MVRADFVTSVELHPMSGSAAGADAGIEVESVATQAVRLDLHPIQQLRCKAAAAPGGEGGQVADVKVVTPGQAMADPKPQYRQRMPLGGVEPSDDSVTTGA